MNIFLIRHGLATSNQDIMERLVNEYAELLPQGVEQIKKVATTVGKLATTKVVYCSPQPRTVESGLIIAEELGARLVLDDRLTEIFKGDWTGLPVEEIVEKEAAVDIDDRPTFRPPAGENWLDVGKRMASFIEAKEAAGEHEVVVVSHDHPIRMAIGMLTLKPVPTWEDLELDNGSLTILQGSKNHWTLKPELTNITSGLPDLPKLS